MTLSLWSCFVLEKKEEKRIERKIRRKKGKKLRKS